MTSVTKQVLSRAITAVRNLDFHQSQARVRQSSRPECSGAYLIDTRSLGIRSGREAAVWIGRSYTAKILRADCEFMLRGCCRSVDYTNDIA